MDETAQHIAVLDHVHKRFGSVVGLGDLSIRVPAGQITVLVGPNGAGKTTALRVITGALKPLSGTAAVFGLDPGTTDGGDEVRRRCGMVSAKPALYDRLSGWDNLRYSAELYGVWPGADITAAADRFGIVDALDQQVGGYSTGMKTRLALARATLHDPDLLLLDEPTSGLDPESSHAVLDLIREMTSDDKTVVMCTHLLLEAEGLADQLVVMEAGSDVVAGVPEQLARARWPRTPVRLAATDRWALEAALAAAGRPADRVGEAVVTEVDGLDDVPPLIDELRAAGVPLTRVEPRRPSLEELYFSIRNRAGAADEPVQPVHEPAGVDAAAWPLQRQGDDPGAPS